MVSREEGQKCARKYQMMFIEVCSNSSEMTQVDLNLISGECQDQGGGAVCLRGAGRENHPDPGAVGGAGQEGGHHCGGGSRGGEPGGVWGILQHVVNTAALGIMLLVVNGDVTRGHCPISVRCALHNQSRNLSSWTE